MKEGRLEESMIAHIKLCLDQLAAIHRAALGNSVGITTTNARVFAALDAMKTVDEPKPERPADAEASNIKRVK